MNEGKPTKAKWWSRQRSEGPSGELRADDGDFELAKPVSNADADAEAESQGGGDFELARPAAVADADQAPADAAAEAGADAQAAAQDIPVTPDPAVPGERPKPLHDPDPYSTPPYGEPGPWAPAPPVQHPATTAPLPATATPPPPPATTTPPPGAPLPSPPASHGDAAPVASNPWQNYDPWSPTPFQQLPHIQNPLHTGVAADPRRWRVRRGLVLGAVALALVSGGVGGVVGASLERNGGVGTVTLPQAGKEPAGRPAGSVAGIAARALPSVVTLHVTGQAESGTGTGFVLDGLGHILTNNHVVEPAGSSGGISVTFNSGDTAKATVVGRDSGYDLAVVKVSGVRGLKPMPLGNSDNVQVGDPVVAIGAPFDLEGTVTSGIISAKERPITAGGESGDGSDVSYVDALQTDAPINPGNSGGPLLDSRARVIGINSAIRSADSGSDLEGGQAGSIGLGFAIPVNQAKRVAEELINTGKATHPVIGVTLDMGYTGDGARVGTKASRGGPAVTAGGPGDKAGIEPGDVITEVDGRRVHSGEELIVRTRAHRPGDRLVLTVRRDGRERRITLVLGSAEGS
ncbi:S1C family serine protease [Streptomyces sp. 7R007]